MANRWSAPSVLEFEWGEFETYQIAMGRRPKTILANRRGWELFVRYVLEEYKDPKGRKVRETADFKRRHVTAWVAARRLRGDKPNTISIDFRSGKAMFSWWASQKKKRVSPFSGEPVPPQTMKVMPLIDHDMLQSVLKKLKPMKKDEPFTLLAKLRDAALIRVFFDGGPRLGEQRSRVLDSWDGREILGMKESKTFVRDQSLSPRTVRAVNLYVEERARYSERLGVVTDALWISRDGKPLTDSGIYQIIKRRTGINPHWYRHNAANLYRLKGGNEASMNDVFGWVKGSTMKDHYSAGTAQERATQAQRDIRLGDNL